MSLKNDKNYEDEDDYEDVEKDFKCPPQHVPWSNPNEESTSHKPATSRKGKHHHHKHEGQSSMEGSKRHRDKRVDEGLEEIKCPPHRVPWSDPNEEWASRKPAAGHKHHHHHHKHEDQDEEAVEMEEGVLFEAKEQIKEPNSSQNLVAEEGIGIENQDTSSGQAVVSPSRRTDVSPGAEAVGTGGNHPTEGRRTRFPERIFPGAYREGGSDNEEGYDEDELTMQSHTELQIPPTLSAELVNTAEEERRVQEKVDRALQRERQLVQDQINQALQRERQQAVVAEIIPEVISKRGRRWLLVGALLLLILIVLVVVFSFPDLPTEAPTLIPQDLINLLSNASSDRGDALNTPSTPQNKALGWLANNTNLATYTDQVKIQRYALATLYYSTNGQSWTRSDKWLSNADVCDWYQFENTTIDCTSAGVSSLSLLDNILFGTIPPEIGMLSNSLEYLSLDSNDLGGTLPNEIALLTKLTLLSLQSNNFIGTLPSVIGLLTNLQSLDLSENELDGTIPSELGSLVLLEQIHLRDNALQGPIPTELAQCQNLKNVWFENNKLTGDIGPIISMLPRSLMLLDLDNNHLKSTVPTSIGTFTNLYWLEFGANNLHGTIPTEVGLLSNLELLGLHSSGFTGTIPSEMGRLTKLRYFLYLYHNNLNGTISTELGFLSNLEVLRLHSNRLTGTFPTSLTSLILLKELSLYDNDLTGSLDAFCGIDFELLAANACGQVEVECACCTHCCDSTSICNGL